MSNLDLSALHPSTNLEGSTSLAELGLEVGTHFSYLELVEIFVLPR